MTLTQLLDDLEKGQWILHESTIRNHLPQLIKACRVMREALEFARNTYEAPIGIPMIDLYHRISDTLAEADRIAGAGE